MAFVRSRAEKLKNDVLDSLSDQGKKKMLANNDAWNKTFAQFSIAMSEEKKGILTLRLQQIHIYSKTTYAVLENKSLIANLSW